MLWLQRLFAVQSKRALPEDRQPTTANNVLRLFDYRSEPFRSSGSRPEQSSGIMRREKLHRPVRSVGVAAFKTVDGRIFFT